MCIRDSRSSDRNGHDRFCSGSVGESARRRNRFCDWTGRSKTCEDVYKRQAQVAKANNATVAVKGFVRFETGEGIEKKEENFAEEVEMCIRDRSKSHSAQFISMYKNRISD